MVTSFTIASTYKRGLLQTIALIAWLISFTASAQQECKAIKVAFAEEWFPVAFLDPVEKHKVRGVAKDIITQLASEHDVAIQVMNPVPWKKAILWMETNHIDVLAGHYWTSSRAKRWLISRSFFTNDIRVFYRPDDKMEVDAIEGLKGHTGAHLLGSSLGESVDFAINNFLTTQSFKDNQSILSALLNKQVDYALMAKEDGLAHLKKWNLTAKIEMSKVSLSRVSVHFAFNKNSVCKPYFQAFNRSVDKYSSQQQLQKLINEAKQQFFKRH